MIGLFAGTAIGASLAMLLGPRIVSGVGDLTRKGRAVRDDMAGAVADSAHKVERFATAARTGHVHDTKRRRTAAERARRS
jgi:hypothetical protein